VPSRTPRGIQLALRCRDGHAVSEAAEDAQLVASRRSLDGADRKREPDARIDREGEARRHDADDGPWPAVNPDDPSDDAFVGAEPSVPQCVADQNDIGPALRTIRLGEGPAP
jgi:hypothetical protein